MRHLARLGALAMAFVGIVLGAGSALAQMPPDWSISFQEAATPTAERIQSFNDLVFWIIIITTIFVFVLMAIIVFRYNAKRNPVPQKWSHNTLLEVLWTATPVIILLVIAIPSFRLLYFVDQVEEADVTLKAIGHQWYWSYEYPDHGDFTFDAIIEGDEEENYELPEGQYRLLETDERIVLPVDTNIRLLTTADDVIHAWAIPAFGVKIDAVPGRVNETWFRVNEIGTYYGQCSELCGAYHGYMPIAVDIVSKEDFAAWVEKAKVEFARADGSTPELAALDQAEPATRTE